MPSSPPHILFVNPWIHDYAAYDAWAKPMGLLLLAAMLRDAGCRVSYIDCLDRFHPNAAPSDPRARGGRGPYRKTPLPNPPRITDVPRTFSRYGIDPEWFAADLRVIDPPDLVLVTSLMTYWYPGVRETIGGIKAVFPGVPVVLGGIYATLCHDHAAAVTGADAVVSGVGERRIFDLVAQYTGIRFDPPFDPDRLDTYPYPAYDLQRAIGYVPLLTARGCPFNCAYCAAHLLQPKRMVRRPEAVADEIALWHRQYGVSDFVFYDDALLVDSESHAIPLFETIIGLKRRGADLSFHTPNAVHARGITPRVATLMRAAGFRSVRLGVETTAFDGREMDRKVSAEEFARAVAYLRDAGFDGRALGAYLLVGLPGQAIDSVAASIDTVRRSGISPILAHYTPIPHTRMWPVACAASRYDLESDPIYTNNAILPCLPAFDWKALSRLKQRIEAPA